MTARRHHALLIGIDAYDGGGSLRGCVNDIDAIQRLLLERVGIAPESIARLASPLSGDADPSTLPTLANIRAALARLADAGPEDRVLVYYAGHGTQCNVIDATGRKFAREALLPKDKILGGERQFLFDWELNQAIAKIASRTSRTTVVLDCCSAGGATRSGGSDRFFKTHEDVTITEELRSGRHGVVSSIGSVERCQVVAACRDDQRARESLAGGVQHGELTRALVGQLLALDPDTLRNVHWGRIWRAVEAAVRTANPYQAPWLFGRFGRRLFGFEPDEDGDTGYAIRATLSGFELDAGTLHGVTKNAVIHVYGAEPTTFAPLGSADDKPVGKIQIEEAYPATSTGTAVTAFTLPLAPRGRLASAAPDMKLRVCVASPSRALDEAIAASRLLAIDATTPEVTLARHDDGWVLLDDLHHEPPGLALIPDDGPIVPVLEHYHAYITPLRMARACTDLPGALAVSVLDCNGAKLAGADAQEARLPAKRELRAQDLVCFAIDNTSSRSLYVTLLNCAASGRVVIHGEAQIGPSARYVVWNGATLGISFSASIPPGRAFGIDRLVAIGTTKQDVSLKALVRTTTFADLLARKARGGLSRERSTVHQWTSATISVRTSR